MAHTSWVDHEDGPKGRSVACGLGEKITLDVVDDNRVAPAEKLGGSEKPLAASGWRNDQEVSKLPAGLDGSDAEDVPKVAYAKNEARLPSRLSAMSLASSSILAKRAL